MPWDTIAGMRDLLRSSLGRSLRTLSPLDRLLAAWSVACGPTLASHGEITAFTDGALTVLVPDPVWRRQLRSMRADLLTDLRRIASVDLREIHFEGEGSSPAPGRPSPPPSRRAPVRRPGKPGPRAKPRRSPPV